MNFSSPSPRFSCAFAELSGHFEALVQQLGTLNNPRVSPIIRLVLTESQGSWLRPQLVFGVATTQGKSVKQVLPLAAAAEMVHCASLLHDDVIDEGLTRRNTATANARYGNAAAVLCGDVLMAKAMTLLTAHCPGAIPHATKTIAELANSALMEQDLRYRSHAQIIDWTAVAQQKTGSLLGFCLAGLHDDDQAPLAFQLGYQLGQFFQLCDDLKDFKIEGTGKNALQDLKNGNLNWVILAHANGVPIFREALHSFWMFPKSPHATMAFFQQWNFQDTLEQALAQVQTFKKDIQQKCGLLLNDDGCHLLMGWLQEVLQKTAQNTSWPRASKVSLQPAQVQACRS